METPSQRRERIVNDLIDDVRKLVSSCNTSVCSNDFPASLSRIDCQGRNIIRNVQTLIDHAQDLKGRLDAPVDVSKGIDKTLTGPGPGASNIELAT